jgi:hydrogenase maturation protein HypF
VKALRVRVTGIVQGVGFRPFVYRIAGRYGVTGWVLNAGDGVHLHAEAAEAQLDEFLAALEREAPAAAQIASIALEPAEREGHATFAIRESVRAAPPVTRISPDLAVCAACVRELFAPTDRRAAYPYINCTDCGPRYGIILDLPYDRPNTTMRAWELCAACRREYDDPADRRYHAQPVACAKCGPTYVLYESAGRAGGETARGTEAIARAAALLRAGAIVAVKGIGGYHLACDAANAAAVLALRERKFRKERPFALMVRDLATAHALVELGSEEEALLTSTARPIVLARAKRTFEGVAPDNDDLGVVLAYAPVQHLLFAADAPPVLVLTSANRSSEPIAYTDDDAFASLAGIADAFLAGERPIARRLDDSVVRAGPQGVAVLRRARGLAPQAVATLTVTAPVLALGADLKNAIALSVGGAVFVSQHVGDLDHFAAREAFEETVHDLCRMYALDPSELIVAHDLHPGYHSMQFAQSLPARLHVGVQHHRAHVASVLAERAAWEAEVVGFAFDGTGYGDDGTIWGGEVFRGSLARGFERVAHLRPALLPGGDAAARFPVQAAAGFLHALAADDTFARAPFLFPERYAQAATLARSGLRAFATTSVGRLFDTVAALAGFTREQTFEGQAATWLEHLARRSVPVAAYLFPFEDRQFDYRPLLAAVLADRIAGRPVAQIAYAFHAALAAGIVAASETFAAERVVASGGVFQNALLVELLHAALGERLWLNLRVPTNDGGICLGQAALAVSPPARA